MKKKLTFEFSKKNDILEIHINSQGAIFLKNLIEKMLEENKFDHSHLFSENWGGNELTIEKQNLNDEWEIIDGVKIIFWPEG